MSRNSKNARNIRRKQSFKRAETRGTTAPESTPTGNKGPAKTAKKHTKVNTWHARLAGKVTAPAPKQKTEEAVDE